MSRMSGYEEMICSINNVYPAPRVIWETEPSTFEDLRPMTRMHVNKQGLYVVNSRLKLLKGPPNLIYICKVTSSYGGPTWTSSLRERGKDVNLLVSHWLTMARLCVSMCFYCVSMLLLSSRNKRGSRERSDYPLLRPCLPEPVLPGVELLQRAGLLPHPHLRQPVRTQHQRGALEPPRGAERLQGPVWRRLPATDGPQQLEAHGQIRLRVLRAAQHAHRAQWCHHRRSRRWVHTPVGQVLSFKVKDKLEKFSNRFTEIIKQNQHPPPWLDCLSLEETAPPSVEFNKLHLNIKMNLFWCRWWRCRWNSATWIRQTVSLVGCWSGDRGSGSGCGGLVGLPEDERWTQTNTLCAAACCYLLTSQWN